MEDRRLVFFFSKFFIYFTKNCKVTVYSEVKQCYNSTQTHTRRKYVTFNNDPTINYTMRVLTAWIHYAIQLSKRNLLICYEQHMTLGYDTKAG